MLSVILLKDLAFLRSYLTFLLLPHFRDLSVDIHRGLDIGMSHDTLDYLKVVLMLTESRTECMPENMA